MSILTYASSRVKRKSFYRKIELQIFWLISGGHVSTPKRYTKVVSPYSTKEAWNVSENNPETVRHNDLRLGQIVYKLVFYNISFSWLLPLDGFQLFFVAWQCKWSIRRLFRVTHVNRKWGPVLLSIFTLIETICPKIWTKPLKNAKSQLLVGFCRSK